MLCVTGFLVTARLGRDQEQQFAGSKRIYVINEP